jgi:hypothetical protein
MFPATAIDFIHTITNSLSDECERSYNRVYDDNNFRADTHPHLLGHQAVAGVAALAGFKAFEDHQRKEGLSAQLEWPHNIYYLLTGKPVSHQFAKEMLAGFAGAEVDKMAQRRGDGWFHREMARHQAQENAKQMYDDYYIQDQMAGQYDPYQFPRPPMLP